MTVLLQALFDKRNSEDVMEERLLEKLQSIVDSGQVDPPPGKTYYLPTVQKAEALVQAIPDDTSRCPCLLYATSRLFGKEVICDQMY